MTFIIFAYFTKLYLHHTRFVMSRVQKRLHQISVRNKTSSSYNHWLILMLLRTDWFQNLPRQIYIETNSKRAVQSEKSWFSLTGFKTYFEHRLKYVPVGQNKNLAGWFKCWYTSLVAETWAWAKDWKISLSASHISISMSSNSNANDVQPKLVTCSSFFFSSWTSLLLEYVISKPGEMAYTKLTPLASAASISAVSASTI